MAIEMNISGDIEIEQTVPVVVTPRRPSRPVTQCDSSLLRHIRKGSIVIIVKEAILTVIAYEDIRPAVIVVVGNTYAIAPTVIRHASLCSYIGKSAIVIIVKQRRMRRSFLAIEGIERRAVHEVNVKPAIVVIINQAHTRSVRFNDDPFLGNSHFVTPRCEAGFLGNVLKDDRAGIHKSARGDRPPLPVEDRRSNNAGCTAAHARSAALLRPNQLSLMRNKHGRKQ